MKLRDLLDPAGFAVDPWCPRQRAYFSLETLLQSPCIDVRDFFFVQIGANNGVDYDPIRRLVLKYNWRGILVEPLPDVFMELKDNYRGYDERLLFENVAVSDVSGMRDFYRTPNSLNSSVNPDEWFTDRDEGRPRRRTLRLGPAVRINVHSVTFMELIRKHAITHIDLLQIDTEGYDYEIIKLVDFCALKPFIIHFEYNKIKDPNAPADALEECETFLRQHGYRVVDSSHCDKIAWLIDRFENE